MTLEFPTRSDTNGGVQPQKIARCLTFRILGSRSTRVEELYYVWSKNKATDLLRGNCAAGLHLCICLCKKYFLLTRLISKFLLLDQSRKRRQHMTLDLYGDFSLYIYIFQSRENVLKSTFQNSAGLHLCFRL